MKKLYLINIMMCIALFSVIKSHAQEERAMPPLNPKMLLYGPDIIISNEPTQDQREISLGVAFNGWLYAAFTTNIPGGNGGYTVRESRDNGITWTEFHSYSTSGRVYKKAVVQVVGTDLASLKIIFCLLYNNTSTTNDHLYLDVYDEDKNFLGEPLIINPTSKITDFDMASDYMLPAWSTSPFGIGVAVNFRGVAWDSTCFYLSQDAGATFIAPKLVHKSWLFNGRISLAYGRSWNYSNGRYFMVWEAKTSSSSDVGHILYSRNLSNVSGSFLSQPVCLDSIDNNTTMIKKMKNPSIACQIEDHDNDSADISVMVVMQREYSATDWDVIGLVNRQGVGGNNYWERKDPNNSGSDISIEPDINYDPLYEHFLCTYFNKPKELAYTIINYNAAPSGYWTPMIAAYNDDTTNLVSPRPKVEMNIVEGKVAFGWIAEGVASKGIAMFDAEYSTAGINKLNPARDITVNVYPNPAVDYADFDLILPTNMNIDLNIFDIMGRNVSNVVSGYYTSGRHTIQAGLENLSSGMYQYVLVTPIGSKTGKIIVRK